MSLEASKQALAKATARDLEDFKKWLGMYCHSANKIGHMLTSESN